MSIHEVKGKFINFAISFAKYCVLACFTVRDISYNKLNFIRHLHNMLNLDYIFVIKFFFLPSVWIEVLYSTDTVHK